VGAAGDFFAGGDDGFDVVGSVVAKSKIFTTGTRRTQRRNWIKAFDR
jgi:hypothetical protein